MLTVENVSVKKNNVTILDNVSFTLDAGTHLCLIGPNGAGKTTLIRAVTECDFISGAVFFNGQNAGSLPPKARARFAGVLSQNIHINMPFTISEVVALGRYAYDRFPPDENKKKINAALEITGLMHMRERTVTSLSGGELRRVFLAQVLAQDPRVLILDEPANDLDLRYQKMTFEIVNSWVSHKDRAAITSVHDLSLAKTYAARALLLDNGRVRAYGETRRVLSPEHLNPVYKMDVTGFLSDMLAGW